MKFKLDENLPVEIVQALRIQGHEAEGVYEEGLAGATDLVVLERARAEHRVLLTLDKGVANIQAYPPEQYSGIVLFRPPTTGRGTILSFVLQHLPVVLTMEATGHLFVVSERGIRQR